MRDLRFTRKLPAGLSARRKIRPCAGDMRICQLPRECAFQPRGRGNVPSDGARALRRSQPHAQAALWSRSVPRPRAHCLRPTRRRRYALALMPGVLIGRLRPAGGATMLTVAVLRVVVPSSPCANGAAACFDGNARDLRRQTRARTPSRAVFGNRAAIESAHTRRLRRMKPMRRPMAGGRPRCVSLGATASARFLGNIVHAQVDPLKTQRLAPEIRGRPYQEMVSVWRASISERQLVRVFV